MCGRQRPERCVVEVGARLRDGELGLAQRLDHDADIMAGA
jgi:hypothetical protein